MGKDYVPADKQEELRVLVGWAADDFGERVLLKMQGVAVGAANGSGDNAEDEEEPVFTHPFFMTKQQAVLLGNFLYRVGGATPPTRKRGWMARLLGG